MTSQGDRRRGIQSVGIALRVLEALAAMGEPATLGTLAQACSVAPSQAHRYLVSLIDAGMAQQDAQSGRYDLGSAALRLGLGALARTDAVRLADTEIRHFARSSGRTMQIAALGPLGPTIIRWHVGRPPVMTSFHIGSVLPVLSSATGHVFLAFTDQAETQHLVKSESAVGAQSAKGVESLRQKVRSAGFAYVEGTMVPGLRATAVPIFDLQGRAILSVTALATSASNRNDETESIEDLRRICDRISRQLGWFGP